MTSLAKFLVLSFCFTTLTANAEVALTADTVPNSLAKCLDQINILPGQQLQKAAADVQNKKIWACVTKTYTTAPTNFSCTSTKHKILNNKNLKQDIENHCNQTYFESIPCLAKSKDLKKKYDEEKNAGEKASFKNQYIKMVDSCVKENARYFKAEFCIDFLNEVELAKDNKDMFTELRNVCAYNERSEKSPNTETNRR